MGLSEKELLFQQLIADSKGSIYRVCLSYLHDKDDVQDLYQEILIALWQAMDRFQGKSSWNTYIYRIAINVAIKFKMNQKKINADPLTEYHLEAIEEKQDNKEAELQQLNACIHRLEDADRILISLVLEDLSYKEIAEILCTDTNNIGVRISRIKKKLSKLMEEHYGSI
ncbi:RNA polymerase ECF-type sigma factor [Indibacter alkaliphilus LW1]|uniref:RNA polymerase ECF-type sigma factor n=1 Tax=Indibacter alkaliphilus (strain CCUG 57479 / KCTC 22604 / LW1) TaxID=1189612 RepID=S2DIF7_INDAL|nr:RNA polymerase sigma factor [Indibacter alkaliphilus]EOZ98787.1 RNA polymerase ECF-type sigma factor [Indibacter alkaliphilus LW1]